MLLPLTLSATGYLVEVRAVSIDIIAILIIFLAYTGDDAEIVVWNLLTGEKMQVIPCPYFGAVAALIWFPATHSLSHGFAFGCADGSIHIYTRDDTTVRRLLIIALS